MREFISIHLFSTIYARQQPLYLFDLLVVALDYTACVDLRVQQTSLAEVSSIISLNYVHPEPVVWFIVLELLYVDELRLVCVNKQHGPLNSVNLVVNCCLLRLLLDLLQLLLLITQESPLEEFLSHFNVVVILKQCRVRVFQIEQQLVALPIQNPDDLTVFHYSHDRSVLEHGLNRLVPVCCETAKILYFYLFNYLIARHQLRPAKFLLLPFKRSQHRFVGVACVWTPQNEVRRGQHLLGIVGLVSFLGE